ncbi:unnamed protein product [Amoebophrya sp. A25]|nr:unnamed protein product [Amoebophrya sp. A25]|eukprot:GSA25T00027025001.1
MAQEVEPHHLHASANGNLQRGPTLQRNEASAISVRAVPGGRGEEALAAQERQQAQKLQERHENIFKTNRGGQSSDQGGSHHQQQQGGSSSSLNNRLDAGPSRDPNPASHSEQFSVSKGKAFLKRKLRPLRPERRDCAPALCGILMALQQGAQAQLAVETGNPFFAALVNEAVSAIIVVTAALVRNERERKYNSSLKKEAAAPEELNLRNARRAVPVRGRRETSSDGGDRDEDGYVTSRGSGIQLNVRHTHARTSAQGPKRSGQGSGRYASNYIAQAPAAPKQQDPPSSTKQNQRSSGSGTRSKNAWDPDSGTVVLPSSSTSVEPFAGQDRGDNTLAQDQRTPSSFRAEASGVEGEVRFSVFASPNNASENSNRTRREHESREVGNSSSSEGSSSCKERLLRLLSDNPELVVEVGSTMIDGVLASSGIAAACASYPEAGPISFAIAHVVGQMLVSFLVDPVPGETEERTERGNRKACVVRRYLSCLLVAPSAVAISGDMLRITQKKALYFGMAVVSGMLARGAQSSLGRRAARFASIFDPVLPWCSEQDDSPPVTASSRPDTPGTPSPKPATPLPSTILGARTARANADDVEDEVPQRDGGVVANSGRAPPRHQNTTMLSSDNTRVQRTSPQNALLFAGLAYVTGLIVQLLALLETISRSGIPMVDLEKPMQSGSFAGPIFGVLAINYHQLFHQQKTRGQDEFCHDSASRHMATSSCNADEDEEQDRQHFCTPSTINLPQSTCGPDTTEKGGANHAAASSSSSCVPGVETPGQEEGLALTDDAEGRDPSGERNAVSTGKDRGLAQKLLKKDQLGPPRYFVLLILGLLAAATPLETTRVLASGEQPWTEVGDQTLADSTSGNTTMLSESKLLATTMLLLSAALSQTPAAVSRRGDFS